MTSSYVVQGESNRVEVHGSMKDDHHVKVVLNGKAREYHTGNGSLELRAASADYSGDDGCKIEEGAATQKISLPDGLVVESKPARKSVKLPDGSVITDKRDTSIEIDAGDGVHIHISSQTSVEEGETENPTDNKQNYSKSEFVSDIVPGFWTSLFFAYGVILSSQGALLFGLLMYLTYFIPSLSKFVGYAWAEKSEDQETEKSEDLIDNVDEIKSAYMDGQLTDEEFESRVGDVLEKDDEEIQYSYN